MAVSNFSEGENFAEWLYFEIDRAYADARKNKRGTLDEQIFEANETENLVMLTESILSRTYRPSRGVAFVKMNPVVREIFAAPFRDRVVHHLLFNIVGDWWDKRFIADSYSCRVGKGTWYGVRRMEKHIRQVSENFQKEVFVVKLDVQGYFCSLPRKKLYERIVWGLDRQFPNRGQIYNMTRFLWKKIIFDDPTIQVHKKGSPEEWKKVPFSKSLFGQQPGRGIVIGNLTSQLLSNIYLDRLDRYITFDLGYKHYGRYVDDFYFVITEDEREKARLDIVNIENFLRDELQLTLHPNKRFFQNAKMGVDFLGAVVYPFYTVPGKRVLKNFRNSALNFMNGKGKYESVESYIGFMKNLNGKKATSRVLENVGWEYNSKNGGKRNRHKGKNE